MARKIPKSNYRRRNWDMKHVNGTSSESSSSSANSQRWLTVSQLTPSQRSINVEGKITEISLAKQVLSRDSRRLRVATAVIEDRTGHIPLTLWNEQIDAIHVGDTVQLLSGDVTDFRGELQLRVGRTGSILIKEPAATQPQSSPA